MTLNDPEPPKQGVLVIFGGFSTVKKRTATKWMKIDKDYLRTRTAIGSLAFHEH